MPNPTNSKTKLDLNSLHLMGILNVTPDSFSDGGKFNSLDNALFQTEKMLKEGATIIDVGGESTRPGANIVSVEEEFERVLPVVESIKKHFDCFVSVDTSKPQVMQACGEVGIDLINDIRALQEEGALQVVADLNLPVCLMHMQNTPQNMQDNPSYNYILKEVHDFLTERTNVALQAGVKKEHILWDVGFGFGKTVQQNYQLLQHLEHFKDYPLLVGVSRKSMIGNLLKNEVNERLIGSVTAALYAVDRGAKILRVHDVKATAEALKIRQAIIDADLEAKQFSQLFSL